MKGHLHVLLCRWGFKWAELSENKLSAIRDAVMQDRRIQRGLGPHACIARPTYHEAVGHPDDGTFEGVELYRPGMQP